MFILTTILVSGLIIGMIAVVSNPSPFFAAWGLAMMSGLACTLLVVHGGAMIALVLFLIYLGGMLVTFAYCLALAAEPYPKTWGNIRMISTGLGYLAGSCVLAGCFEKWTEKSNWCSAEEGGVGARWGESAALSYLYEGGAPTLFLGAFVLFLTLFVVFELVRGLARGAVREV
uniref:NADH dehydrogenase subunit 6 n=1 Tax=Cepola schlegelii TaxID=1188018 RepID=UPI002027F828|nr:NADH dehydrogenase subunit 6 [Cepola schlegelii]UPQ43881.1 NADH dehydrogenase subunit 6 [Cepola schlegelii]